MSIDVEGLKDRVDIVAVIGSYVSLKKRGAEYLGLCPFHSDKNPSLWVSPVKKFCHCFACDANHDVISFVQEIEGLDFKGACEKLGASDWKPKAPIAHEKMTERPERITAKPPPEAPKPDLLMPVLKLEPVATFEIRDLDGSLLGYECRYEPPTGKKEIRVWTWGARGEFPPSWRCGHFNAPRPLYGLPRLREKPQAPVSIFEGPKKADAGARLLPPYACVSWTGGANAWSKHDLEPLRGRNVLLWPDADEPGWLNCEKLAAQLADPDGLKCSVRIVDTHGMPEGWDIADAEAEGWDTVRLVEWAKPKAHDYVIDVPEPVAAPEPPAPPPPPDEPPPAFGGYEDEDAEESLPASMSEDMLADRFAKRYGGAWRYVKPWASWFEWRRDGWYKDDTAKVDRLAVEITRQALYWEEAKSMTPDQKRRLNSKRTAGAVRDLAYSDRRIAATTNQWDTNPMLLGVPGGVVELDSGKLRDAKPDDYITKRTCVAPAAGSPARWLSFLETVTGGDAELTSFLQRFGGYSLTGETREQCLAFLYGTGQNGKGVFITTLSRILGDYAVSADADVFMESDHNRHPTEMARLRGARLVYVDETDSSKRWNEKRIKRITGGGRIEAHFMRQDDFEFEPQFKLLIAGNHKPQLRGVGKAIQRRIHLVPFTVTIPDDDRDDKLVQKLEAEYPQILQWLIDGCIAWNADRLRAPRTVSDATSQYIEGEDTIGEWLEERTEQAGSVARPVAYKNYRVWADGRGERPWSTKAFWAALEERGYVKRKSDGTWFIDGMTLRMASQPPDEPGYEY